MNFSLSRALSILAVLTGLIVFLAMLYRAQFGIDFTDDSFYASLTNKLARGGTLFVDEFGVMQLGQLLVVPFAWVHRSLTGSTHGLILFLRCAYLVTALLLSLIPMLALKKEWGFPAACLIGLLGVAYIPFNIIAFSYNTLGMQLLSAGLFLGYLTRTLTPPYRTYSLFLVGILFGADILAYPTLIVPHVIFAVIFLGFSRSWRDAWSLLLGWHIFPLLVLGLLGFDGLAHLQQMLSFHTANGIETSKFIDVWITLWDWYQCTIKLAIALLMLAIVLYFASSRARSWSLIAFVVLMPLPFMYCGYTDSRFYVILFAFTAPLSFASSWRSQVARELFLMVWVPSAVGGYVTALTSYNGAHNMAIGIFPALVASVALLLSQIRQGAEPHDATEPRFALMDALTSFAVPLFLVGVFTLNSWRFAFCDSRLSDLTTRIEQGPFAKLYTSPERVELLSDMTQGLNTLAQSEDRVFFFYDFPAGYLLTDLHWASNCSWQSKITTPKWIGHHRALEHYWKDPNHQPTIIVKITTRLISYPYADNKPYDFAPDDQFLDLLEKHFTPILRHQHFTIYRRNSDPSTEMKLKSPF
jgi:hypothetical protein